MEAIEVTTREVWGLPPTETPRESPCQSQPLRCSSLERRFRGGSDVDPLSRIKLPTVCMKHIPRSVEQIEPALKRTIGECLYGLSPWPLLIHGSCGAGKTCAALAACDQFPDAV